MYYSPWRFTACFFFRYYRRYKSIDWPISWMFPVQVRANIAKNRVEITFRARSALRVEGEYRSSNPNDISGSHGTRIEHFDEMDIKNNLSRLPDTPPSGHRCVWNYKIVTKEASLVFKKSICSLSLALIDRQTSKIEIFYSPTSNTKKKKTNKFF